MILIADSGSTKTEWVLLDHETIVTEVFTMGINPYFQDEVQILELLKKELFPSLSLYDLNNITQVFYYGAGCSSTDKCAMIRRPLAALFKQAAVQVDHDLLAAARAACGTQKGIAAILGTGSNSCLFDGVNITANQPSLGFILGDEGSGGYMGKELIKQFLYGELNKNLHDAFLKQYAVTKDIILEKIYKQPLPNRYAASFVPFLKEHIYDPQIQQLVKDAFECFFRRHISSYKDFSASTLSTIGSVAYIFEKQLREVSASHHVTIRNIIQKPMEGLIAYHKK